ncbi:DUF3592 domain-containing protein [Phyllobacterium sp. 628]|uniref:DUF3592 domain-containing protein n=1 Tax=Phyllobacterium sp. 628 TaxID=2718938 RepID=UPI0016625DE6|nr:DUF3592 domain-containing protein [Phyllobacterium sp. 628]QND54254.1 DUF3592 domain-containing protein [Phyllobacterium sp. 628]
MIVFTAIGIGFLIAAAVSVVTTTRFLQNSIMASGNVTALNAGGSHPQISFITQAGEQISYPQGGLVFGTKVGDQVEVRYRAEAPKQSATLNRFGAIWTLSIFLSVLGAGFTWAGLSNISS